MNTPLPNLPEEEIEDQNPSSQKGFSFRPYLRIARRKAWLIAGITSLTTFGGWMLSAQDPYSYTGNFYLLVEPITSSAKLTNPTTLARTEGVPRDDLFGLDYPTNLVFLTSPGMTLKIAQDVQKKELSREVPAIWKDLRENLKVTRASIDARGGETKIFAVSYTGENPREVQSILSVAAETFVKYSAEDRETNIKAGVKFIDNQLPDLQQRLDKLKTKQKQLRQQYELVDPLPKNNEILTQISSLKQEIFTTDNQLTSLKTVTKNLQDQLNLNPDEAWAASTLSQDPARVALMNQLQELERQIVVTSTTFTENSQQIQYLQDQKNNLVDLLNKTTQEIIDKNALSISPNSAALQHQDPTRLQLIQQLVEATNQIKVSENQRQALTVQLQKLEQQSQRYPGLMNEYGDIERQIQLTEELLNKLLLQRETLKVESAQDLPWQLISEPQIPLDADGKPIGFPPSRTKKILAGVMGGLLLGMGIAVLWEKRSNVFWDAKDIKDAFSISLLANIPQDDRTQLYQETEETLSPSEETSEFFLETEAQLLNLQTKLPSQSSFLEAFDALYAQLYLLPETKVHSLLVTSVEAKDGQSTVAMHLAISAANAGQKVLLVDGNWYETQLHDWLNVSNQKGLCQLLNDGVSPQEIIQDVHQIKNLSILTSGNIHSPKKLWSRSMQQLMTELVTLYDLVIYDVPHFFDNSDIKFMATKTDGIVMVIGLNKTPRSLVEKAIKEIQSLNLPLLGAVTNQLNR